MTKGTLFNYSKKKKIRKNVNSNKKEINAADNY